MPKGRIFPKAGFSQKQGLPLAALSPPGHLAGSTPARPFAPKQCQVDLQDRSPRFSIVPGFPLSRELAVSPRTARQGGLKQRIHGGIPGPRGLYLISQWHPGNEWWLQERRTPGPWQQETTRKELPDHGLLRQGMGEGTFLTLWVIRIWGESLLLQLW